MILVQATVTPVRLRRLWISTEEGENYREFLHLFCQEKVGESCSFCCEWTGPPRERYPSPVPDHCCLPEYHNLSYQKTKITKWQDNWQPRLQARKGYASDGLVLSNPESVALFANKFIVKSKLVGDDLQHFEVLEFKGKKEQKKRRRKVGRKDKSYEDYPWTELGEDETKLKKSYVFQN